MNNELSKLLHERVVRFVYQKSDGSIREAVGTLKKDMCPDVKGGGKPTPEHLQLYFDLEKKAWRSFRKELLIRIEII